MKRAAVKPTLLALLAAATLAACGDVSAKNDYNCGAINLTNARIDGVAFRSPTLTSGWGILMPGYEYKAIMGIYQQKIPAAGQIDWTSADKIHHSVLVTIPLVAEPFDGMLFFKIMPDNSVIVVILKHGEFFMNDGAIDHL